MSVRENSYATACLSETVEFVRGSLQASAAIFVWVGRDGSFEPARLDGVRADLLPEYFGGMHVYDPLNIYEIVRRGERAVLLENERKRNPTDHNRIYSDFLKRHNILDEVDFVFRQSSEPIGVLAALRCCGDPPFDHQHFQWNALHRFLEFTIGQHPRARRRRVERALATGHLLTPREVEVMGLLQVGASNSQIADALGIRIATVKTYVINILDKLGVDSRTAAVSYVHGL
jgi:DNA-binding CsgD family transcriptional regulator